MTSTQLATYSPSCECSTVFELCHRCLHGDHSEVLGYGERATSYYIRCHECHEYFKKKPAAWKAWQDEMKETQVKLDALHLA